MHVYVDTWNAPPEAIGATVLRSAAELQAFAVVLASNDQVRMPFALLQKILLWQHSDSHICVKANAPPEAIGATVLRLAAELQAFAVVLASNDQVCSLSSLGTGLFNISVPPCHLSLPTNCTAGGHGRYSAALGARVADVSGL